MLLRNMFFTKVHQLSMNVLQGLISVLPGHSKDRHKKMGCLGKDRSEVRLPLLLRDEFKDGIQGILPGLPNLCQ